jgi:hypothetical protein
MCKKSFTVATFVRHSIFKLPENYYLLRKDISEHQIATGKGFFAHTPVINSSVRVNPTEPLFLSMKSIRLFYTV